MVKLYKSSMLVLLETKIIDHKRISEALGFEIQLQSKIVGQFGGIIVWWKKDILKLEDISITSQGIHAMVKVLSTSHSWIFSSIYASNILTPRSTLWDNLISISQN